MAEMKATTIRFSERTQRIIASEAEREGASLAQYVREAAIMRVAWERAWTAARAQGPDVLTVTALAEVARQILDSCE